MAARRRIPRPIANHFLITPVIYRRTITAMRNTINQMRVDLVVRTSSKFFGVSIER